MEINSTVALILYVVMFVLMLALILFYLCPLGAAGNKGKWAIFTVSFVIFCVLLQGIADGRWQEPNVIGKVVEVDGQTVVIDVGNKAKKIEIVGNVDNLDDKKVIAIYVNLSGDQNDGYRLYEYAEFPMGEKKQ
jgi:hypothetical protein